MKSTKIKITYTYAWIIAEEENSLNGSQKNIKVFMKEIFKKL
jgi:hypothetical protein